MMSHAVLRFVFRRFLIVGALALLLPGSLSAQDWAQQLFSEQQHDFGTVATGSECWHRIKITNNLKDPLHISGVRTSCSCAMVRMPEQTLLQSRQSTYLEIGMDTRLANSRNSNVIVTIDAPQFAEVKIPVKVYIRTDVVFNPGEVNFGPVEAGKGAERKVEISYVGRPNWTIQKVETNNPNLSGRVVETFRDNAGQVRYDLFVALNPKAPPGNLRQQIALMTDDLNGPMVPVLVQGRIEADITVVPPIHLLGNMAPGDEKTVNFVIRGHKPIHIEKIEVDSNRQNCKMVMPKETKPYQVLTITIAAPSDAGDFTETFTVTIEGRDEPITFTARGKTVATAAKAETESGSTP
ncbi:MAG: DUF1573 domain-containing protein [Planctomycetaceae bacterium]